MVKRKNEGSGDSDLGEELNEYEPSDSDDEYDDNEKLLLEKAKKGISLNDDDDDDDEDSEEEDEEEEVLGVYSSDEEDTSVKKKRELDNMDSDIEGMEDDMKLPDPKAWGKKRKDYYYTDYVDRDTESGFIKEKEENMALLEEREARTLHSRLAAQLDDIDLLSGLSEKPKEVTDLKEDEEGDIINTDLSQLSKRDKLILFQKESPEFFGLVSDIKEKLSLAHDKLFPIMKLMKCGVLPCDLPCSKFVELKIFLILNYSVNLSFYLLLKRKRTRVKDHPVIGRLLKYRLLLNKLNELDNPKFNKQFDDIISQLKMCYGNENISIDLFDCEKLTRQKKKNKLSILKTLSAKGSSALANSRIKGNEKQSNHNFVNEIEAKELDKESNDYGENCSSTYESSDEEPPNKKLKEQTDKSDKRPITYEIAKNKGLTPYRKKEQRNSRVKHRNKYRRALIKRKGQVREGRKEISKYGGEISGIKASVIKSRKFK